MNYKENKIDWKVGDLVIHDADAKRAYMLMKVVKIQKNGRYVTKYISNICRGLYKNDKKYLHNPLWFGLLPPGKEKK